MTRARVTIELFTDIDGESLAECEDKADLAIAAFVRGCLNDSTFALSDTRVDVLYNEEEDN